MWEGVGHFLRMETTKGVQRGVIKFLDNNALRKIAGACLSFLNLTTTLAGTVR